MLEMDRHAHTRDSVIGLLYAQQMLKKLPPVCRGCGHYAAYRVTAKSVKNMGRSYYAYVQARMYGVHLASICEPMTAVRLLMMFWLDLCLTFALAVVPAFCRCPKDQKTQCKPGFLGFADKAGLETIVREAPPMATQPGLATPPRATQAYPQTPASAESSTERQGHRTATAMAPGRSLSMEFNQAARARHPPGPTLQQAQAKCAEMEMEVCPYSASHGFMKRDISWTVVCVPRYLLVPAA